MTNNQIKCINHVKPFFSIIMPVYNGERFLEQAMKSILWQTFTNLELIVVDDRSTDATSQIVKKFSIDDQRIRYIRYSEHKGVSIARNTGLDVAQGQYVGFCDADDYWEIDALQKVYDSLIERQVDMVVFGFYEDYYDDAWQLVAREKKFR